MPFKKGDNTKKGNTKAAVPKVAPSKQTKPGKKGKGKGKGKNKGCVGKNCVVKNDVKAIPPTEKQISVAIDELCEKIVKNKEDYRKAVDTYFADNKGIDFSSFKTRILKGVIAKFSIPTSKVQPKVEAKVEEIVEIKAPPKKIADPKTLSSAAQNALSRISAKVADFNDYKTPFAERSFWVTSPDAKSDAEIIANSPVSLRMVDEKKDFDSRFIRLMACDERECYVPNDVEAYGRFVREVTPNGEVLRRVSGKKIIGDCKDGFNFEASAEDPNIVACFKVPSGKDVVKDAKKKEAKKKEAEKKKKKKGKK